ncbi:MAG: ABC transporter permease [Antricoccus sp.]
MKALVFAGRNTKELLRDPLSLLFMIGLPLVMLFVFSAINSSVPVAQFDIGRIGPGIAMFSLTFISLFSGMLLAGDRESSFLARLRAAPLTAFDFLAGYTWPLLGVALVQTATCFVAAFTLGLPVTWNVLLAIVVLLPVAVFFIGCGLLMGALFTANQVGGSSALLINVAGFLGGIWLPLQLIGGGFKAVADALPFSHPVEAAQAATAGDFASIMPHLAWCIGYAVMVFAIAVLVFRRKITR